MASASGGVTFVRPVQNQADLQQLLPDSLLRLPAQPGDLAHPATLVCKEVTEKRQMYQEKFTKPAARTSEEPFKGPFHRVFSAADRQENWRLWRNLGVQSKIHGRSTMGAEGAAPSASFEVKLIAKIQAGKTEAEAELYEKYSDRVYYLALRQTRSSQDAEDVRAETFLRVLQAIRGNHLRSASSVAAFILGTTRNVLHEFTRRSQPQNADGARILEASVPSHERLFVDSDIRSAIEQTIARLKPRERELLRLYYYEELPRNEIAQRTGITEERVRLVKSRALKHFREIYAGLYRTKKTDTNSH